MTTTVDTVSGSTPELIQNVYDTLQKGVISTAETLYAGVEQERISHDFSFYLVWILLLWAARVIILKSLVKLGRGEYAETYRITKRPLISDMQLERESIWVYGYFYDFVAMLIAYYSGYFVGLPMWSWKGLALTFFFHATIVEFVYYWFHRLLHVGWFYKKFHSYHHKSINTTPMTGVSFEFVERFSYTLLFAIAPVCTVLMGELSLGVLALYFIWFDIMNEGGHINFEPLPAWFHKSFFKYIVYSPTFHSVHHTKFKRNYSLFMPWSDLLFSTASYTWGGQEKNNEELLPTKTPQTNDFVLLVHASYLASSLYSAQLSPKFWAIFKRMHKYEFKNWMYLLYPYISIVCSWYCYFSKTGHHNEENFLFYPKDQIDGHSAPLKSQYNGATWIVRNLGFQYLMPMFKKLLQDRIEKAVLDAQDQGIRVVGLGNFNKAEWINHGGADIVANLKDKLNRTYISHGDTLSAAAIFHTVMQLKEQGYWSNSVYITGATSKIGRAVVLCLAKQHIRVVMLTQCKERYDEIADEAGENREYLIYSSDLADGKSCDLWLTGKMLPHGKQLLNAIPKGTTILNFAVPDPLTPKLLQSRPDLLHLDTGLLAFDPDVLNPKFTWLLPKGLIYACLAGAVVHSVLKIEAHEVGPVVIEDMEKYWNAALALGFKIPAPCSFYNPVTLPPKRNVIDV